MSPNGAGVCAIALGADPSPFVAAISYTSTTATATTVARREEDGGSWTTLHSPLNAPRGVSALRIGADGNPIVAWIAGSGARIAHWSGTEWTSWGELNDPSTSTAVDVTLGLGAAMVPLAGWVEERDGGLSSLLVASWTGNDWLRLGQAGGTELQVDSSAAIGLRVLGVTSQGRPKAVWTESRAVDGGATAASNVFAATLVDGRNWQRAALGDPCIGTFMIDPSDGIIDACTTTTSRWDGVDWVSLGSTFPLRDYQSDFVVGSSSRGWPVIAWEERTGRTTFYVRVFNR